MGIYRQLIFILFIFETNAIFLKNGGYEDVYVLIRERVKESGEIIQRIKDVLTSSSRLLFTATHNQLFFRKIKIIVPKTWSHKQEIKQLPNPPSTGSFFSVDNGVKLKAPQVKGHLMCGKAGEYIHLPAPFLLKKGKTNWGHHDRVIVHEWGHLRWGLFNELPMKGKEFYLANGKWNPTRCTDEIKGSIKFGSKDATSSECDINDTSKPLHEKCRFKPDSTQNVAASLMSYPFINKLSEFCDQDKATVKKEHRHHSFIPTIHNERCHHKSAWEIMKLHSDFQNAMQLPESTNTTPTFEIIQETTNYRVFVLDVSGSMDDHGRLKTLQQAIENVIQNLISKGSWVGIVSFSTNANVEKDFTIVNTQQDRDSLIDAIPNVASGSTCIGCGLREAKKILTKKLGEIANGEIILISDGEETESSVHDAKQEVIAAKITVHTIAVSQQADHLLEDIARETGGKYYAYFDNGGSSLITAFSQTLSNAQTSSSEENVMLMSHRIDTVDYKQHNISFAIEEGLGADTTFTFITSTDTDVQLQLTGPINYNQSIKSHGSTATLSIPGIAQAGEYEMIVTTETIPGNVEYYVKSGAISGDIVRTTSMLSTNNIDLSTGDLPIIYSEVCMGYLPVLNASVTAHVETGDITSKIGLKDDGIVDEKTEVYDSSFQRVEILEQLMVSNYKNSTSTDWIAPGKITDVSIHYIQTKASNKAERRNFTISWTATGDDKSFGRAASYIFKIADDFDDLLNNFDNATILEVTNGSLIPKHSGETEVLKIVVDAEESFTGTAFFAVQAVDESGNKGSVSNIISILVAKGYRTFSEEGTLEIEKSDMTSSAGCFHARAFLFITSISFLFLLDVMY